MTGISKEVQAHLIQMATKAREHAYAPYSHYKVGAAVLLPDGSIQSGCNVENASYGLTICAERVAYSAAVARGIRDFVAIAVVTSSDEVVAPCGACRQFMAEFNGEIPVIMTNLKGEIKVMSLGELLPLQFGPDSLP
jgi:cytidine deaminase